MHRKSFCSPYGEYGSSISLNEKLSEAITAKTVDYRYVETLLDEGADPLGGFNDYGETALQELFFEAAEVGTDRIPKLMTLFIEKGLDCSRFLSNGGQDENSELWSLYFAISKEACEALKLMIDHGLSASAVDDFIEHYFFDTDMIDCMIIDDDYIDQLTWGLKMVMLAASYPHILNESDCLKYYIGLKETDAKAIYDPEKFRSYDDYSYKFYYRKAPGNPQSMANVPVEIIENSTGQVVWEIRL